MSHYSRSVTANIRPTGNAMAFVSLLMGLIGLIMAVVVGWIPIVGFFLILLPTLLGIIFGYVAKSQAAQGAGHGGKAIAGLTCGFVGLVLTGVMQLLWAVILGGLVLTASEVSEHSGHVVVKRVHHEVRRQLENEWKELQDPATGLEMEIELEDGSDPATQPERDQGQSPESSVQDAVESSPGGPLVI